MSKSTANWKKVVTFIKTCSVDGLEAVMSALNNRVYDGSLTPEQQAAFSAVIDKDNVEKSAAKLTAATATGSLDTFTSDIAPVISGASFADIKRYVHAVDTRLKSLPVDQRMEIISAPASGATVGNGGGDATGEGLPPELAALLGGAPLPPEGAYMGDSDDDGSDDDDAFLDL